MLKQKCAKNIYPTIFEHSVDFSHVLWNIFKKILFLIFSCFPWLIKAFIRTYKTSKFWQTISSIRKLKHTWKLKHRQSFCKFATKKSWKLRNDMFWLILVHSGSLRLLWFIMVHYDSFRCFIFLAIWTQGTQVNRFTLEGLLFWCLKFPYICKDFFAVKTLRFTCLPIKLVHDQNTITTPIQEF